MRTLSMFINPSARGQGNAASHELRYPPAETVLVESTARTRALFVFTYASPLDVASVMLRKFTLPPVGSAPVMNHHPLERVRSRVTRYKPDIYTREEPRTLIPVFDRICLGRTLAGNFVVRSGRDALSTHHSAQRNRGQKANEQSVHRKARR